MQLCLIKIGLWLSKISFSVVRDTQVSTELVASTVRFVLVDIDNLFSLDPSFPVNMFQHTHTRVYCRFLLL